MVNQSMEYQFSVLMSVYAKDNPNHLWQCFESLMAQTLLPEEIVLVEDGILTEELYRIINEFQKEFNSLKIISYKENKGLGYALNIGLHQCTHDIVARMDADDICYPERFEKQIPYMEAHPEVAILSSWISEFIDTTNNINFIRTIPESHQEILSFAKRRNPINHPVVVLRKQAVEAVGGYKTFYWFEDYYLWIRLLLRGYIFHNIQQPLLYFRQSNEMFNRRGGIKYIRSEIKFQKQLLKYHFISPFIFLSNIVVRILVRLLPNSFRKVFYIKFLRKRK